MSYDLDYRLSISNCKEILIETRKQIGMNGKKAVLEYYTYDILAKEF